MSVLVCVQIISESSGWIMSYCACHLILFLAGSD